MTRRSTRGRLSSGARRCWRPWSPTTTSRRPRDKPPTRSPWWTEVPAARAASQPSQASGEVASKPLFVVTWTGLTGGTGGGGDGLASGPLCGPPGVGGGGGLGGGGTYAAFGSHHSWNSPAPTAGARKAMPEPSGAHVGWATIRFETTVFRVPRLEPFQGARVRYETCFS